MQVFIKCATATRGMFPPSHFALWKKFFLATRAAENPPFFADASVHASRQKLVAIFCLYYLSDPQPFIYQRLVCSLETQQLFMGFEKSFSLKQLLSQQPLCFFFPFLLPPPTTLFRVNTLGGTVHWSASQLNTEGFRRDRLACFPAQPCIYLKSLGFSSSYSKLAEARNPQL